MKASAIGIVSAAVLTVVAGAGLGITQAEAACTEKPVAAIEDQEVLRVADASGYHGAGPIGAGEMPEGSNAYSSHELQEPVATFEDQGADDEDSSANSNYTVGPIGAGKLPEGSDAISSHELQKVESDGVTFYLLEGYQYGPD